MMGFSKDQADIVALDDAVIVLYTGLPRGFPERGCDCTANGGQSVSSK